MEHVGIIVVDENSIYFWYKKQTIIFFWAFLHFFGVLAKNLPLYFDVVGWCKGNIFSSLNYSMGHQAKEMSRHENYYEIRGCNMDIWNKIDTIILRILLK